jgi:hypothetical protein
MKRYRRLPYILAAAFLICSMILSCKLDDVTPPDSGGTPTPKGTPKGSGTLSFQYSGPQSGTISFSGKGYWPPSGTGVAAAVDSLGQRLQIVAYQQLTTTNISKSNPAHFAFIYIDVFDISGLSAITYSSANAEVVAQIGLDVDTSHADSLAFQATSGSITIDSRTPTQVVGSLTLTAVRPSDGATLIIPNGSFSAKYIQGAVLNDDRNPSGIGGKQAASIFGPFPVPSFPNIGGIVGVCDLLSTSSGPLVESKSAFGAFYPNATTTEAAVYAGSVSMNGNELDTVRNGRDVIYLLPSKYNPNYELNISFNGSTTAIFNVFGSNDIPPIPTFHVTAPSTTLITSPAVNALLSKGHNLQITWTIPSTLDSIMLVVADQGGHSVTKQGLQNTGTYTVNSTELSHFFSGLGTIFLVKYRYTTLSTGGTTYIGLAEVANERRVSFY